MYDRATKFLNDHSVLSSTQYGFRSNFSTEHAVLDIVNTCNGNIEKKMFSDLVLLDLTINLLTLLITKFYCLNLSIIRGIVLQFYKSFLENTKQFVRINKFSSAFCDVNFGVPQPVSQSVSVSLFMYQYTQTKKNPNLEYAIASK